MTQAEQNGAFRTRDEQIADHFRFDRQEAVISVDDYEAALRVAEARGAAEQRRKDAEGQEMPRAYEHVMTYETDETNVRLSHSPENAFGEPGKDYSAEYPVIITPLYGRPANVAAMEARIAELEGAITALFDGQCVLENRGWDEKPDRIVLYDDEQMASGKDPVSVAVRGAANVRAALTREGGV